jgi:hypothetical protein
MSRSFKKTPIFICCGKKNKARWNRKFRRVCKNEIHTKGIEADPCEDPIKMREEFIRKMVCFDLLMPPKTPGSIFSDPWDEKFKAWEWKTK